ncbi:MAG TPA: hypothetical protein VH256_00365, partial [Thermoleophilaceae bacterium]|nr:hypothetical protein [Thermoleophilaceae bacterium]
WAIVLTGVIVMASLAQIAATQRWLLGIEIATLAAFAIVALIKVYANSAPGSLHVSAQWFNPFQIDSFGAFVNGLLLGVFIYWGWDSGVAVNEGSEDAADGPGKSAVVSTLLAIYLVVSAVAQAWGGTAQLIKRQDDVLSVLGTQVKGPIKGALLGSTAYKQLHVSDRPVVVVPG